MKTRTGVNTGGVWTDALVEQEYQPAPGAVTDVRANRYATAQVCIGHACQAHSTSRAYYTGTHE